LPLKTNAQSSVFRKDSHVGVELCALKACRGQPERVWEICPQNPELELLAIFEA
jgi:hypothetical protein